MSSCKRHAAAAPTNLDAAITMRFAKIELQNPIELRATASEIAPPKPGSRRQSKQRTILKHFLKAILEGKSPDAALQYDLRCPAAKDNSIMHAAAAPSNLDAATTNPNAAVPLRSATNALQIKLQLRRPRRQSTTWMQPLQCDLHP